MNFRKFDGPTPLHVVVYFVAHIARGRITLSSTVVTPSTHLTPGGRSNLDPHAGGTRVRFQDEVSSQQAVHLRG